VQRRYLPRGSVASEVAECVLEPVVDLVQRQLVIRGLDYCLENLTATNITKPPKYIEKISLKNEI
jgi:hypothetical protein